MQKSLHIDPGKCTGCLQCEMACSYEHTGTFNPSRSFIKVFTFHHEGRFAPYTCTQCDEAWCVRACPVDAISIDAATGAKVVSDDKCVGCKVCTIACPWHAKLHRRGERDLRSRPQSHCHVRWECPGSLIARRGGHLPEGVEGPHIGGRDTRVDQRRVAAHI